jgi:AcrR family transcriptional regulator
MRQVAKWRSGQRGGSACQASACPNSSRTATRLEDVARRAGVAKGLPHFYFDSKEELFKAVLRRLVVPDWSLLDAQLERPEATTTELLRGLMTIAYERLVKNTGAHQLLRLLIAEGQKFPELAEFYHAELIQRALALLGRLLARGVERGDIRPAHCSIIRRRSSGRPGWRSSGSCCSPTATRSISHAFSRHISTS